MLEESGLTLEIFDALEKVEKKSFGIYVENDNKGFYLTVWESGEVQTSIIDYNVASSSPNEKYLPDVEAGWLDAEFQKLLDWIYGSEGQC
jgi:hypothetical protein